MTASAADRTLMTADGLRPRQTAGKALLVGVVAGSLVAASLLRGWVMNSAWVKPKESNAFVATSATTDQFDSYTLGLLLGGLRGPLVMTLWSSSEAQKGDRNLEDINTKIELIRLLQPEFDSVHLFQIWNKAYNLSVQMANLPSKYATILDAIDYANRTRSGKENINIEAAVAGIYFDKLGGANEKAYYRERVRDESQQPSAQVKFSFPAARRDEFVRAALAAGADPRRYTLRPESGEGDRLSAQLRAAYAKTVADTFTGPDVKTETFAARSVNAPTQSSFRSRLDPVLDADGKLLERNSDGLLLLKRDKPASVDDLEWHPEYGDLQYLQRFEPFPSGVSPFAFSYNYYKRATALQVSKNQSHAQLSDRVISSRMTLALKSWAEEEIELGRYAELAHFGRQPMAENESPLPLEMPAADIAVTPQPLTPLLAEAMYDYARAGQIADVGTVELREHLKRYADDMGTYGNLKADLIVKGGLARGDAAYLKLITSTDPAVRDAAAREAVANYTQSIDLIDRIILAYYVPDEVIKASFPQQPGRIFSKIDAVNSFDDPRTFPAELLRPTLAAALQIMRQVNVPAGSEIGEYQTYLSRIDARLARLGPIVGRTFTSSANLSDAGFAPASSAGPQPLGPDRRFAGPMLPATQPTPAPTSSPAPTSPPTPSIVR